MRTLVAWALLALPLAVSVPASAEAPPILDAELGPGPDLARPCPPPANDTYRILYCAATRGIPKTVDQFLENMTTGPPSLGEAKQQASLLANRTVGCVNGHYPPCPRLVHL